MCLVIVVYNTLICGCCCFGRTAMFAHCPDELSVPIEIWCSRCDVAVGPHTQKVDYSCHAVALCQCVLRPSSTLPCPLGHVGSSPPHPLGPLGCPLKRLALTPYFWTPWVTTTNNTTTANTTTTTQATNATAITTANTTTAARRRVLMRLSLIHS